MKIFFLILKIVLVIEHLLRELEYDLENNFLGF